MDLQRKFVQNKRDEEDAALHGSWHLWRGAADLTPSSPARRNECRQEERQRSLRVMMCEAKGEGVERHTDIHLT